MVVVVVHLLSPGGVDSGDVGSFGVVGSGLGLPVSAGEVLHVMSSDLHSSGPPSGDVSVSGVSPPDHRLVPGVSSFRGSSAPGAP